MKRRHFIAFVAGAVVACPLGAGAQPARRQARVGILNYFDARYSRVAEFTESLRELGYIEGQISSRFTAGPTVSSIDCPA
jgi:hypothetical protein